MFINAQLLSRFQTTRNQRKYLEDVCRDTSYLKPIAAQIWADVRNTYNIPSNVKLKVELDGELAGQLRYKDTDAAYLPPYSQEPVLAAETIVQTTTESVFDSTPAPATVNDLVDFTRAVVINDAGLAVICCSLEELTVQIGSSDCPIIYRVAA